MPPPRYPSDLSDEEWIILEPLLSQCSWRMLPREYPPWQTVYYHFRKGGSTDGSEGRTTGCAKRCVRLRDATGTPAPR
jgi:transposase